MNSFKHKNSPNPKDWGTAMKTNTTPPFSGVKFYAHTEAVMVATRLRRYGDLNL